MHLNPQPVPFVEPKAMWVLTFIKLSDVFYSLQGASAASAETVVPILLYTRRERSERRDGSAHFPLYERI